MKSAQSLNLKSLVNSPYAPYFERRVVEVDYGVFWTNREAPEAEQKGWRVTYIDHDHKVVAVRGDQEVVLAEHVSFMVVETVLTESLSLTGNLREGEVWWAWACNNGSDIKEVANKLQSWQGAQWWTYSGKDGGAAETAFAKAYAKFNGFSGAGGGWIYGPNDKPYCQGWRSFFNSMKRAGRIKVLAVDAEKNHIDRIVIFKVTH